MSGTYYAQAVKIEPGFEGESSDRRHRRPNPGRTPQIGMEQVALTEKIYLPIQQFPTYNFVGKLLGPKGSNLKGMQAFVKCKMSIKGKGSTKDASQENELLATGDEQHQHLIEPLHVVISVRAPRIEAHRRLAAACRELNKFMGPVNEEIHVLGAQQPVMAEPMAPGREILLPAAAPQPQIMFGVPPPGAIILNEHPTLVQARPQIIHEEPRPTPPRRESYSPYGRPSESRGGKRGAPSSSGYQTKRFKVETYTGYTKQR